eukprot:6254979-Amphidinium_carterae.4
MRGNSPEERFGLPLHQLRMASRARCKSSAARICRELGGQSARKNFARRLQERQLRAWTCPQASTEDLEPDWRQAALVRHFTTNLHHDCAGAQQAQAQLKVMASTKPAVLMRISKQGFPTAEPKRK